MPKRSRSVSSASSGSNVNEPAPSTRSDSPVSKYSRTASAEPRSMFCTLPPHEPLQLDPDDFDAHYAREHTNRCTACASNLPSGWLLELHIRELHDPIVAAEKEKGEKIYKCFVPTCEKVCSLPAKRRLHLIDKHQYPREYDFGVVEAGVRPGRASLLGRDRSKSNDARVETSRKGGGLGKMTAVRARRRSSVAGSPDTQAADTTLPAATNCVPNSKKEQVADDHLDKISATMAKMRLDMTPRSVLIKKSAVN